MLNATRDGRRLALTSVLLVAALATTSTGSRAQPDLVGEAMNRAQELQNRGKLDEAIKTLEDALPRVKRLAGADDPGVAALENGLGQALAERGRYKDAEAPLRDALRIVSARPEMAGGERLNVMNNLVEVLVKLDKFDEALKYSREALEAAPRVFGPDDPRTNLITETQAKIHVGARRPAEAIPLARRALASAVRRHGADDPETITYRDTLATALMAAGQYPEAKSLFEESLKIAQEKLPPRHEFTRATLNKLAGINELMGRPRDAAAVAKDLDREAVAAPPGRASDKATELNNLAILRMRANQFEEAESLLLKSQELIRQTFGAEHQEMVPILGNLAQLYRLWGKYPAAERYAIQALDLTRKTHGPDTMAMAKAKATLANVYMATGRFPDAESCLKESHDILKKIAPDHPDTALVRENLATVYRMMNRSDEALKLQEGSLPERGPGRDNREAAMILLNRGQSLLELRQPERAEPDVREALGIFEKVVGPESYEVGLSCSTLAVICLLRGRVEEAESNFRRALAIAEKRLGPGHPEMANMIDNYAMGLLGMSKWPEAVALLDRSRRMRRGFLDRTLPALSEDDQFSLLEMGERASRDVAVFAAVRLRSDPRVAAMSAEWMLNSKAVTVRALARRTVLARDSDNPAAAPILRELADVGARYAALTLSRDPQGNTPAAHGDERTRLAERMNELSRRLGQTLENHVEAEAWAGLSQVRAALPADATLVEFVRTNRPGADRKAPAPDPRTTHYVAWVIPPAGAGDVNLVDLAPAGEVEGAVTRALAALQPTGSRRGEPEAERAALAALKGLSDLLYEPLRPHLEPSRRWVISPDAALWLVPWAALPVGEGRYAVEDHLIHLTVSGRDLLAPPSKATATKPAILAAPDYNLDPGRVLARARELGRDRSSARGVAQPSRPRLSPELLPRSFEALPGVAAEAEAVRPLMQESTGVPPDLFLGAEASETVFKSLKGPRALVLSTHGVFLDEPDWSASSGGAPAVPANPLLRCGLVLAGYNRPGMRGGAHPDDGLLTGLEVVGCDLRGTELVVLSACVTGLGEVRGGEGIAGLRQSFQIAGAEAVVASLWSIPDTESYQLMAAFYHGLARHKGPATALREAQLALIADRRARLKAAHPFYWAAFALTGSPGPAWRDEPLADGRTSPLPPLPRSLPDPSGSSISPVTGRREAGSPWADAGLALVLLSGGTAGARWWWRLGRAAGS
jgi:CHAT domain-containing protein/tetratricopeptide (TPR) repeat protein